jgi:hypothetical protein
MSSWLAMRTRLLPERADVRAGLAGLLIGAVSGFGFILWSHRSSPVTLYSAFEVDGVVSRSGHLDLQFNIDRTRDCPSQTSRWLWTWINRNTGRIRQYFPLTNSNTTITSPGDMQRFVLSLPMPPGIWPGDWFYTSKTVEHCSIIPGLESSKILQTPDIPVRVIDDP